MGNKRKNKKELRSRGRSRDISEKAIMVKRGTCARAKRRRRSGKFDSASNMFDDTAQPQLVRCISSPKMGQPIKRQVQGDRRFRRRQQRRDSNSSSSSNTNNVKWNFDDSRKLNESYSRERQRQRYKLWTSPKIAVQQVNCVLTIACPSQFRVQVNESRVTTSEICVISVRNSN